MDGFAKRITELREQAGLTKAQVARRAGISGAYLTGLEKPGSPKRVSVPIVRGIADAIPGALRSELLVLAGHEEDALYDEVRERKQPRPAAEKSRSELLTELRHIAEVLEQREQSGDGGESPLATLPPPPARPGTQRTGSRGTRRSG